MNNSVVNRAALNVKQSALSLRGLHKTEIESTDFIQIYPPLKLLKAVCIFSSEKINKTLITQISYN
jgi:hypothetical protein